MLHVTQLLVQPYGTGAHNVAECGSCNISFSFWATQDCYRASDHVGHDVFYYVAQQDGSGCCDCGDPAAWSPKGFCARHGTRAAGDDPRAARPEKLSDSAAAAEHTC